MSPQKGRELKKLTIWGNNRGGRGQKLENIGDIIYGWPLRLNNDHIHIVEQEMRKAIQVIKT